MNFPELEPARLSSTRRVTGLAAEQPRTVKGDKVLTGLGFLGLRAQEALPPHLIHSATVKYACRAGGHPGALRASILAEAKADPERPYCEECWATTLSSHRTEPEARVGHVLKSILPGVQFEKNVRPPFTYAYDNQGYEFSLYAEDPGLAVEVHGPHHYEGGAQVAKSSPELYQKVLERDYDRIQMCQAEGVAFVTVPHDAPDKRRLLLRALTWADIAGKPGND
jgi:hypothetical protein